MNGWLIVAGGLNSSGTALTSVWCSRIPAGGAPGGWQAGPRLPAPAFAYSPGWNLAVTDSAIMIVAGDSTGGDPTVRVQALTVTPDGPGAGWQTGQNYIEGGDWQTAAYPGPAAGSWEVFNLHLTTYDTIPLVPVPIISVPLPASGLTAGDTYHLLLRQHGGDLNDYASVGLDPSALPGAGQFRPSAGGPWTGLADDYGVIAAVCDQAPEGRLLHLWEDAGARVTSLVYAGASSELLGVCESVEFADGTTLASVTQVTYGANGLPAGTVQLA